MGVLAADVDECVLCDWAGVGVYTAQLDLSAKGSVLVVVVQTVI